MFCFSRKILSLFTVLSVFVTTPRIMTVLNPQPDDRWRTVISVLMLPRLTVWLLKHYKTALSMVNNYEDAPADVRST